MKIKANITDIQAEKIFAGVIVFQNGSIEHIEQLSASPDPSLPFVLPGFIDAHVHIESSMLVPAEFARLATVHGTVATVSDPHEIANVCGMNGIDFMIRNGRSVNFKFFFGAPSCVPATAFETAGDAVTAADIENLLSFPEIKYLSEMMNFPGVIAREDGVMQKIAAAHRANKPVDGHAPGLTGEALLQYHAAGISTDHECFTAGEALAKLKLGMKILIREGSAARNFEALAGLLHEHFREMMFCSDDKHPDSLVSGHINQLCQRAVALGVNVFKVLRAACVNPVQHYKLDVGLLKTGDPADFIVVRDLIDFEVMQTYINGECVAENGQPLIPSTQTASINKFHCNTISAEKIACPQDQYLINGRLPVIEALDGQLITGKLWVDPLIQNQAVTSNVKNDILKIIVVNRYRDEPAAISFIKNFGLKTGAIASSVAHDSHNIIAVGADDESICRAVNEIIEHKGGISCADGDRIAILPLPVAGLMSPDDGYQVAAAYSAIDTLAKSLGSTLSAPFMTLSFMALLVIPALKLSDRGLFDAKEFSFIY